MNYKKLSASMAALYQEYQTRGLEMLTEESRSVALASFDAAAGAPEVHAFIRCDPQAPIESTQGVSMHRSRGSVRTGLISLDALDKLSDIPEIELITPAVPLRPLNDLAGQITHLPVFRGNHSETGSGVVIGIVDSGIDPSHPAFTGRIHSIWDQTIPGPGWGTTNFGTVLTGPTLIVSRDSNGHGTHVAGIATGDDAQFGGVAPRADIVCVKTNFQNVSIGDGIRYIFSIAETLNRPAVVNLSLGGHTDPHDGSDDLSELIAETSGPGRIVVAAAGNEGGNDIHAAVDIPAEDTVEIMFRVPSKSLPGRTPFVRLNGWYGADQSCEIGIVTSSGDTTPLQPVISSGDPARIHGFSNALVIISTPPTSATLNGDHHFIVELRPGSLSSAVQGGVWRLVVRNTGSNTARIDVWSIVPEVANDAAFTAPFNSLDMKIGSPGCAAEAITVGSFTSRNQWTDSVGGNQAVGLPINTMSDFSSPGPLRNGSQKPDVAAPGAMIVSCLSAASAAPASNVVNSSFRVNAGTSMACPYITGLVALLLEADPTLDPVAIKARLRAQSTIPGAASGAFDPLWGFGLIDAGSL